jgi:hypothetical protein
LVSPDGLVYAGLYRVSDGGPWRLALSTVTDNGSLIQTASPGVGLVNVGRDHVRAEVCELDVRRVEDEHRRTVAVFAEVSKERPAQVSLAELAARDEAVSRRESTWAGSPEVFRVPLAWMIGPAFGLLAAPWVFLSRDQWASQPTLLWLGLALTGALPVYLYTVLVQLPQEHAKQDRALAGLTWAFPQVDVAASIRQVFSRDLPDGIG